ncbi:MAG: hypothetical protein GY928_07200, partial [Colwellia sp.]|nr:hypothetical protein [Colwellia sp.]
MQLNHEVYLIDWTYQQWRTRVQAMTMLYCSSENPVKDAQANAKQRNQTSDSLIDKLDSDLYEDQKYQNDDTNDYNISELLNDLNKKPYESAVRTRCGLLVIGSNFLFPLSATLVPPGEEYKHAEPRVQQVVEDNFINVLIKKKSAQLRIDGCKKNLFINTFQRMLYKVYPCTKQTGKFFHLPSGTMYCIAEWIRLKKFWVIFFFFF